MLLEFVRFEYFALYRSASLLRPVHISTANNKGWGKEMFLFITLGERKESEKGGGKNAVIPRQRIFLSVSFFFL